jgi:hypothetical protein
MSIPKGRREKVIENFARVNGWTRGAELGVWKGRTYKHLLTTLPNLTLIGVDLYAPQVDSNGPEKWVPGENGHEWDHEKYFREITEFRNQIGDRAMFYRMKTVEAANLVEDESLDFVFIDADHSFEGCNIDILTWAPKVKKGGYVMGHDVYWKGVNKAIRENFGDDYKEEPDEVWWHQKK